jgi:hypothetical protein
MWISKKKYNNLLDRIEHLERLEEKQYEISCKVDYPYWTDNIQEYKFVPINNLLRMVLNYLNLDINCIPSKCEPEKIELITKKNNKKKEK